jgi:DNA transformation protein
MASTSDLVAYVSAQMSGLGTLQTCSIFGGVGIQVENRLVAIVIGDRVYLHTDERNRPDYTSRGMGPLRPYPNAFNLTTDQYECPPEILRDAEQLQEWARRALQASIASARAKQLAGIERSRKMKAAKRKAKQTCNLDDPTA